MSVTHLRWGSDELSLLIAHDLTGPVRLLAAGEAASMPDPVRDAELCAALARSSLPLVEIQTAGGGRLGTSGKRHVDGAASCALRYVGHEENFDRAPGGVRTLRIRMADEATGLSVAAVYTLRDGVPVLGVEAQVRTPATNR